ncbi:DedA family protein [Pelomicrobium sp. G1]|uniref:DedA family protein n=1 Tax=unclassified Pelomicrobium TaxID=2815318 RepID=UPI003F75A0F8
MDLATLVDLLVHLDRHLVWVVENYGVWIYALLFLIVFCETGLVVTPFLPGDSLLFVAGALAAAGTMDVHLVVLLLVAAAILGDTVNYWVGKAVGPRVFHEENARFFRKEYLDRTHRFYERHGGKTIVIARFVPIIRTFAPFVAGIGTMEYGRFLFYNVTGAVLWVVSLTYAGYYFGNLPWVKANLTLVILGIVLLSISPGIFEYLRQRAAARQ